MALFEYKAIYIFMKIEGPNKTSSTKGVSKAGKKSGVSGAEFSSLISSADEAEETAGVAISSPIGALGALLAVQEDGRRGSPEANERAKKRASSLLDKLDSIKMGILRGELPRETLEEISQIISTQRDADIDPQLAAILDEIDLRAQVELAKLGI